MPRRRTYSSFKDNRTQPADTGKAVTYFPHMRPAQGHESGGDMSNNARLADVHVTRHLTVKKRCLMVGRHSESGMLRSVLRMRWAARSDE